MTDRRKRDGRTRVVRSESLIETLEQTPEGLRELAAARLALDVQAQLQRALKQSGMKQSELAVSLGSTEGRVSQVLGGGNLTLATIARMSAAMGYSASVRIEKTAAMQSTSVAASYSKVRAVLEPFSKSVEVVLIQRGDAIPVPSSPAALIGSVAVEYKSVPRRLKLVA